MKNKGIAILLALFLGGLGAHKFYMGDNTKGILFLLFSWTFIPGIIACFNIIGYLLTSEEDWNAKYNGAFLR